MAAILQIITESDIRLYAKGGLPPERKTTVQAAIQSDERAQALFHEQCKMLNNAKDIENDNRKDKE